MIHLTVLEPSFEVTTNGPGEGAVMMFRDSNSGITVQLPMDSGSVCKVIQKLVASLTPEQRTLVVRAATGGLVLPGFNAATLGMNPDGPPR